MSNTLSLHDALPIWSKVTVKNSVFFQNESDTGTIYTVADRFYFINNTVVNNTYYTQFNGGDSEAGMWVTSFASQVWISNNIFWHNYGVDVLMSSAPTSYVYNNNYQGVQGDFNFIDANMSVDPQLEFFVPQISSPMVDRGRAEPDGIIPFPTPFHLDWSYGDEDFSSADRVVNSRVDIGAVEAPAEVPIFKHGFEQTRGG